MSMHAPKHSPEPAPQHAAKQAPVPFHYAFPVNDLESTREFYVNVLGCEVGREAEAWIDFNFYGHQISAHVKPEELRAAKTNAVDGDDVPVRHFGAVLPWEDWNAMADLLKATGHAFLIEPHIRFKGEVGEQATMFLLDPSGNALEFKSFKDPALLFSR